MAGSIYSATDLVNQALALVAGARESEQIADITSEADKTACKIRPLMPAALDATLQRVDWREASTYLDLGAALAGTSIPEMADWDYAFLLPTDCIVVREQIDQTNRATTADFEEAPPYLFTGTLSNADQTSAYIRYTKRLEDSGRMSQALKQAYVFYLAFLIAGFLKPDAQISFYSMFENYIQGAGANVNGLRRRTRNDESRFTWLQPGLGIGMPYLGAPFFWPYGCVTPV